MKTFNYIFFGWASAILGRSTRAMKSGLLVNINYKESSLTLKSDEVQILTAHKEHFLYLEKMVLIQLK